MTFFPQKTPSGGGFNQFAQTAAPLLLGIGAQARGDTAGIARGMALMQAKKESDQRKAAIDNLMSGMGISGAQKDFLSSLPVELQQQYMLQQMAPKERRTQVINGKLVDLDTLEVLGDFGDPGPQALTPDQMNGLFGGSDYGGGLDPYLVGGGTRPDAVTGLDGGFRSGIESMIAAAPPEIQKELRITSGYRSPDVQERLFTAAIEKYGSADAARKWVAPPGNSKHNHGSAVDFKYLSPAAQQWVHANAAQYGLHFPLEHEPWHVEPVGSRGGAPVGPRVGAQPQQAAPQPSTLNVGIDRIGRVLASGIGTPAQRDELKFQREQMIARRDAELKRLEEVRKEAERKKENRRVEKDANGRLRYFDTKELVFPDVEAEQNDPISALRARAKEAGLQPGTPEYQQFMMSGGSSKGMRVVSDGEGGFTVETDGAVGNTKFNETESKTNTYAVRAKGALDVLDQVGAAALASRVDRGLEMVPGGIGRELQSEDYQVARQAGDEFLQAILRKDTGAAIHEHEQTMYGDTYLPRPGDGPRVLEAKRQARIRAIAALESGMSAAQQVATDRAIIQAEVRASEGVTGSQEPAGQLALPPHLQAVYEKYGAPTGR